jgi:hypothetical protein
MKLNFKNRTMKKLYTILCILIGSAAFAQAPLLVEDFDYTAGDLLTAHGWVSHSGGTTNAISVTTPGLTFAGYVGSGIGLSAGVNNTGQDVNKVFTAQTSGSVYTSFLVNSTANTGAGEYFFMYRDEASPNNFRARTFIIPKTGMMSIGFSFNATAAAATSTTELNFGETYLFVVKYTIVDGVDNDKVSLYVFKAGDNFTAEPATPFLGPLTATRTTPGDLTTPLGADISPMEIALRQFNAAQRITVDGFRVKTTWDLAKDDAATGLNGLNKSSFSVYPNPVINGRLNISTSANSMKQVEIYNIIGNKMRSEETSANSIDVQELKTGLYIIKVMENNQVFTSRFTVK